MSLGVRHILRRRIKLKEGKEPFERISVLKTALDILMYPVAVVAPLALVPQVWQLYATHNASSISMPTWAILVFFNMLWIFYGWVHRDKPIIITNIMFGFFNFLVALGVILYR